MKPLYADSELRLAANAEISMIGAVSEPLSTEDFVNASLIASGIPVNKHALYVQKMTVLLETIAMEVPDSSNRETQAEQLLVWMHENILTRYVETQTRMDVLLDNGCFNCVSSAVLYMFLSRSRGIPVLGVLTNDHAFARVMLAGRSVDVETTTPYGFDPGSRKNAVDSFAGITGFRYVPPGNYRDRTDIGEKEMISLIYQNRIAVLQQQGRWVETVGLARDRYELAGTQNARMDYVSSLNNYGAYMGRKHHEAEALRNLLVVAKEMGFTSELDKTAKALWGNAVTRKIQSSAWEEARVLLEDPDLTVLVPNEYVAVRLRELRVKELENDVRRADFGTAVERVNQAFEDHYINNKRWQEFIIYLYSREAQRRTARNKQGQKGHKNQQNRWLNAYQFLKTAPDDVRSINEWGKFEENYRKNSVAGFHNRFVQEVRRRDFESAAQVLDEAMRYFPEEKIFMLDREKLK